MVLLRKANKPKQQRRKRIDQTLADWWVELSCSVVAVWLRKGWPRPQL